MTHAEPGSGHFTPREAQALRPSLPCVSVVIVNYNYGRYLAQAIESVFAQTYPCVECLVVDNASSDDSLDVIAQCQAKHPELKVLRRADNGGQTLACFEGFAATSGPYVIFLDADDYLLEHCVATHMLAHLSSRVHVGFTSADMLQMVDGQAVLSTSEAMNIVLSQKSPADADVLRPTPAALGELWSEQAAVPRVRLVPRAQTQWVWAPTSGNCFRRDALRLFADGTGLGALMSQTDLFLALGVNAVSGSLLIDEPLFAYRLHGSNAFTSRPQLQGVLSFDFRRSSAPARIARSLIVDTMTEHIERFVPEPGMGRAFFAALRCCDVPLDEPGRWRGHSAAARAVARRYASVVAAIGPVRTWLFLARCGAPLSVLAAALSGRVGEA